MIIDIPYVFEAFVIRPRCQIAKRVGVQASVPVKIAELTAEQAPLAARFTSEDGLRTLPYYHDASHPGGAQLVEPWRPLASWAGAEEAWRTMPAADLQEWISTGKGNPFTPKDRNGNEIKHDVMMRLGDPVREWVRDDRQDVLNHIHAKVAGAVIVDGLVCLPSRGPVWRVRHQDNHQEPVTEVCAVPGYDRFYGNLPRDFRGDRLDDAIAHAVVLRRSRARDIDPEDVGVTGTIEVFRPEALTFDDDWLVLTTCAGLVLKENADSVHRWTRADGLAYVDLRDAMQSAPGAFSVEALDAARQLADAYRSRRVGYLVGGEALAETVERIDRGRTPAPEAAPHPAAIAAASSR